VGHAESIREKRNTYKMLVGNPAGKRPLGDPNLQVRWEDNY
jgi:hypothetical protein